MSPNFYLLVLVILWFFFSSANVVSSKIVTKAEIKTLNCAIATLLLGQYICGSIIYFYQFSTAKSSWVTKQDFKIGLFYFIGNLSTLISLAFTSVYLNQVIKCLEPIFTALLSAIFFKNYQDKFQNFYMTIAVLGACISASSDLQFDWLAVFLACASNLAFASRNVYLKFSEVAVFSPKEQLGRISFCSFVILLPYWIVLVIARTNDIAEILTNQIVRKNILIASVSHVLYNLFSLQVLSSVENAVSHGLLNILKRPTTILASSVLTNGGLFYKTENYFKLIGISITIAAQFLYRMKIKPSMSSFRIDPGKLLAVVIIIFATLIIGLQITSVYEPSIIKKLVKKWNLLSPQPDHPKFK